MARWERSTLVFGNSGIRNPSFWLPRLDLSWKTNTCCVPIYPIFWKDDAYAEVGDHGGHGSTVGQVFLLSDTIIIC